jgi:transcriptional regulator with XRE-family HTH domain
LARTARVAHGTPLAMDTYRHTLPPQVASDLRAARLASPWSLTSLAAEVGISRGHLIRIQNGTRAPSSIVAIRLVYALGLNRDYGLGADLIRHSIPGAGHDRRW